MKLRSKIKIMCVAIGFLGMLLTMPITLTLADTPIDTQASFNKEEYFTTIAKGKYCQWDEEMYLVIQDRETWEKVWTAADIQRTPEYRDKNNDIEYRGVPRIDFTKNMVIAAFMGNCPTPDFSIEINRIVKNTVYIIRHVPSYLKSISSHKELKLGTMKIVPIVSSINSCPYHLIITPILTEPVEFHITTVISNPPIIK
jgi:hypothetical protein